MRRPPRAGCPFASRVVRATLLVAGVTAFSLAATTALVARIAGQRRESRRVDDSARALAAAIRAEETEEGFGLARAAADVFEESGLPDHRLEVWRGAALVAGNRSRPSKAGEDAAWIVARQPIEDGVVVLVAAPKEPGRRALSVFLWSLAVAAPICLGLAWLVGRAVSARATRPLADFRDRIVAARPGGALPSPGEDSAPAEVRDLDEAFRDLWGRLGEALSREKDFAANASHELRTPLTRLRLHLERARSVAGPSPTRDLEQATEEVDRMVRLVDSLLVLARDVSAGVPREVVNVADVARQAAGRVFPEPGAAAVTAPDEALVYGDEELIDIAIDNLLDNARKFSRPGRPIDVRVGPAGDRVTLSVRSPGARVPSSDRERLFERFYRGPEARVHANGHGLGLALSRHIARLHGGEARCASDPDEDACFVFELPGWKPQA